MIMGGTTPRSLGWGGTLAVLGGGLLCLPLLPALALGRQEDPKKAVEIELKELLSKLAETKKDAKAQADKDDKARAELEQAKAELARAQAVLEKAIAEVTRARTRVAALEAGRAKQEDVRFWSVEGAQPVEIILRKVGDKWEVVQPKKPAPAMQPDRKVQVWRVEEKDGVIRLMPAEGAKIPPPPLGLPGGLPGRPTPGVYAPPPVKPPAPEGRIESLERQMQQIMKELEALRREMKRPPTRDEDNPKPTGAGAELKLIELKNANEGFRPNRVIPKETTPKPAPEER